MLITHQAKLISKTKLSSETYLFKFSYPDNPDWTFKPGQYMIFHIPQDDGHPVRRLYSIASIPANKQSLDFVIEYIPNGKGSIHLSALKVGETTTMQGPAGMFTLRESPREKIFLATGTGIAPIKVIIESVLSLPENKTQPKEDLLLQRLQHLSTQNRMHLFWGMKTCADMYFMEDFKKLKGLYSHFFFKYCFSRETDLYTMMKDDAEHAVAGRVTVGLENFLLNYERKITEFDYYLCGAHPVVESLREYLAKNKVPKEQVIFEKFTTGEQTS